MEEKNLSYVITQRPLSVGTLKHLKNSLKKKMGNDFLKSLILTKVIKIINYLT